MVCRNPACLGNYDFDHISEYAIRRYVEGHNTVDMLVAAKSATEVEEISLVCLLDVSDNEVHKLELSCRNSLECEVTICRKQLRDMIEYKLKCKGNDSKFKKIL